METRFDSLIAAAKQAAQSAYTPRSGDPVGAALLARDGGIFSGANVELGGSVLCAERVALANALLAGKRRFTALALYAQNPVAPCETCRRALREFGDLWVIRASSDGGVQSATLSKLANGGGQGERT